jgi:asparagine synthase (glutamine-hydrolysing)
MEIEKKKLKKLLEKEVEKCINNGCEGILLSGGLDTSILTYIASKKTKNIKAFTLKFLQSSDEIYARKLCEILKIKHYVLDISYDALIENLRKTIEILKVFEPIEIRNSVAIYSVLNFSKNYVNSVMTGDGADELFFGYDFLIKMGKNERKIYAEKMWGKMRFSSLEIGEFLGIKIFTPYLSDGVKNYAINLEDDKKINGNIGKWILRKSFEGLVPDEFIWREKVPIEYGSGTTKLTEIIREKIKDKEFEVEKERIKKDDEVIIRDKEHLFYYQIYKEIFRTVPKAKENELSCKGCGAKIEYEKQFCKICGTNNE